MSFVAQNGLESSLMKAATDPAHRPQFYRDLMASEIFVVDEGRLPVTEGRVTLKEEQALQIRNVEWNGKMVIPVFSSVAALHRMIENEVSYVGINAVELMKITHGSDWILNPGLEYGKEFTKEEIASIIDGSIFGPSESYIAEAPQEVMLGQPANYPHKLVEALVRYFKQTKAVKRAYLAHFCNAARDEKPHTLIGVEATGNWDEIMGGVGIVIQGVEVPDPPVDFIRIEGRGGVEDYFLKQCKPFYEKKFFGLFS